MKIAENIEMLEIKVDVMEKEPHKMGMFKARMETVPPEQRVVFEKMVAAFKTSFANVDHVLIDNEELPYCGGMKIIYTPGHTIGHISLYFKQSRILIAGDTFNVVDGMLVKPPVTNQYDQNHFEDSIEKLSKLDIDRVICFHGGLFQNNVNLRIQELSSSKA